jgi:response regulator RpfG family c-di-GMP phosphodiesterase
MVELHTGTNFPAVSLNSLFAAAMMKHAERWNGTGAPTQSIPQAASLTLSACND